MLYKDPTYIFGMADPFSHMVWLSCKSGKSAEEVFTKFAKTYSLEEGCWRVMITDLGREFHNGLLKSLIHLLLTRLKFTPAYHPRGN